MITINKVIFLSLSLAYITPSITMQRIKNALLERIVAAEAVLACDKKRTDNFPKISFEDMVRAQRVALEIAQRASKLEALRMTVSQFTH